MISLLSRFRLLSFLFCFLSYVAPAQPAAEPTVSLEFSLFAWKTDLPELRYSPRAKVDAIEAFGRTQAHNYTGPATLRFYATNANLNPVNGVLPSPVATVTLPANATKVTLVTTADGRGRFQIYAVPEDGDALPEHSIRFHNFTLAELAVAFDENSVVQIPPAGTAVIKPKGDATVIRVAREENGRWMKLFNNVVELTSDARSNVILAPNVGHPVVMISLPPWPPKAAPAQPSAASM